MHIQKSILFLDQFVDPFFIFAYRKADLIVMAPFNMAPSPNVLIAFSVCLDIFQEIINHRRRMEVSMKTIKIKIIHKMHLLQLLLI